MVTTNPDIPELTARLETERFGPFVFQVGAAAPEVVALLARTEDAHEMFRGSPLSQVADRLEREVLVSSIYGTNTIEGGRLTEQETSRVLDVDPDQLQEEEQRRVANIKRAYDMAREAAANPDWQLDVEFIRGVHAAITNGLTSVEQRNEPGAFRSNPKNVVTEVGNESTGGRYRPPQNGRDVSRLMTGLAEWHGQLHAMNVPALVRAPLVHLYFELIHPFWDGNGRVGRVIEATLLLAAGFRYAPFALARYYLDHIQHYFALFNLCRQDAAKKKPHPNAAFVAFHLEGMLATIKLLQDRVHRMVDILLFEAHVRQLADRKEINARQYAIFHQLIANGPMRLSELQSLPWYQALYNKRNAKTMRRDLARLRERGIVKVDESGGLWPGFMEVKSAAPRPGRPRRKG